MSSKLLSPKTKTYSLQANNTNLTQRNKEKKAFLKRNISIMKICEDLQSIFQTTLSPETSKAK